MFFYGPVLGIAPLTEAIAWPSELALPLWAGALCASLSAFSVCLSTGFYGRFGWRTYMLYSSDSESLILFDRLLLFHTVYLCARCHPPPPHQPRRAVRCRCA